MSVPALLRPILRQAATRRGMALAALASALAGGGGVVLLASSAWLLVGAALAKAGGVAVVFAYAVPMAAIRLFALLRPAGRYGERYLSHRSALLAMAGMRARLFATLAARDHRRRPLPAEGEAVARLADDIAALEALMVRQPLRWGAAMAMSVAVGVSLAAGWRAALALALLALALVRLLGWLARRWTLLPGAEAGAAMGEWRARLVELASARAEIAAYGLEARAMASLDPAIARFDGARRQLDLAQAGVAGVVQAGGVAAIALVLWLGRGSAPALAMAALAAAAGIEVLAALAQAKLQEVGAREAGDRLSALTADEGDATPAPYAAGPGELRLGDRVYAPGSRIALTGASGSGKTMVLEQLAGLRGGSGALALDGVPISAIELPRLAARFAISPQSAPVLLGTIAENLRLAGADLPDAALWRALEIACLAERVRAFSAGLAERVGEGGLALSGGERKRLSLARALLAGREWLLLDEPTEGLDAATEAQVVDRLRDWLERTGSGLVIASHRPAPLALTSQCVSANAIRAS